MLWYITLSTTDASFGRSCRRVAPNYLMNLMRWLIRMRGRERVPTLAHARAQRSSSLSLYDLRALLPAPAPRPYTNKTKTSSPSTTLNLSCNLNSMSSQTLYFWYSSILRLYLPLRMYVRYEYNIIIKTSEASKRMKRSKLMCSLNVQLK